MSENNFEQQNEGGHEGEAEIEKQVEKAETIEALIKNVAGIPSLHQLGIDITIENIVDGGTLLSTLTEKYGLREKLVGLIATELEGN